MQKFLHNLLILAAVTLLPGIMNAQTTQVPDTVPYFCDFEDATENANWTLENGSCYNIFVIDTSVNMTVGGNKSLYIAEENTIPYHYKVGSGVSGETSYVSSRVFAYRDIFFPEAGTYEVGYWWNCMGENQFDFGRVALAPVTWVFNASTVDWDSTTSVAGQYFGSSTIPNVDGWQVLDRGYYLSGVEAPEYFYNTFEIATAGTYRLVVAWNNDGNTGVNPPIMIDDISISLLTCPRPTLSVGNLTDTSVTFSWVENGTATTWLVDWDTAGVATLSHHDTLTTTTYNLSGLIPGGQYTFNLRAYCDVDDMSRIAAYNLTMPTCPFIQQMPYSFDFDSASYMGSTTYSPTIPCWTVYSNGITSRYPYLYSGYSHTGAYSLYYYYTTSNNYTTRGGVILPGVEPQSFDIRNIVMNFWAYNTSSDNAYLLVGVCGDPNNINTFTTVDTVRVTQGSNFYSIPLSNYNGIGNYPALIEAPVPYTTYYACYVDDIELTYEPCGRPSINVDSITPYSAHIYWNTNDANTYVYALGDTTNAITTASSEVTLDTLSPNTVYTVWVKAYCTINASYWTSRTFTTGCAPMTTLPWFDDIENCSNGTNSHPNCWILYNDATGGYYAQYPYVYNYAYYAHSGSQTVYMYMSNSSYGSVGDPTYEICVLPEVDTNEIQLNAIRLSFWAQTYDYGTPLIIGTMTNAYDINTFVPYDTVVVSSDASTQFIVDMDRFEGSGSFIAVRMNAAPLYQSVYMDDFKFSWIPDCRAVSNVVVSNLQQTSVDLSWTENDEATEWNVSIYAEGEPASSANVETAYDTTITITDLEQATKYFVSITPACDGIAEAYEFTFTTPCDFVDSLPLVIDFENAPVNMSEMTRTTMTCWNFPNPGTMYYGYPLIGSYPTHSGSKSSYWYNPYSVGSYGHNYMVSPGIDLNTYPISNIVVSFWAVTDWGDVPTFEVGVMTNPDDINTFVPCQRVSCTLDNYDWELLSASLSNYTGTGNFIAIRSVDQTELGWPDWYGYVDDITIDYVACAPVLPIVATTTDSVYLSWMGTADSYEIAVYPTNGEPTAPMIVSGNTLEIGDLSPNTSYTVEMRQICGTDTSSLTSTNIRTQCGYVTLPYFNGFEDEVAGNSNNPEFANCWERITDANSYYYPMIEYSTYSAHSGGKGLYWYHSTDSYNYGTQSFLVLPATDPELVPNINNLQLTVWVKDDYTGVNYQFALGVFEYDPVDSVEVFVPVDTITIPSQSDWTAYEMSLANYTGTGRRVAFCDLPTSNYFYCYLDDFELEFIPTCRRPEQVAASGITTNSANLTWSHATATEFVVTCTDPAGTTISVAANTNSATVTGLTPNTDYAVAVYAICTPGDTSRASFAYNFHTECTAIDVLPYTNDFENDPIGDYMGPFTVECWHRNTDATTYPYMYVTSYGGHSGSKCIYWYNTNSGSSYGSYKAFISPAIDSSIAMDTLMLSFWLKSDSYGSQPEFSVGVMTDPSDINTFTEIESLTHTETTTYVQYEVSLAGYTGTGRYIAIKTGMPASYNYMYVDDVTIDYLPSCYRTNGLHAENVTSTSATLHWTNNSANSIVSYYTATNAENPTIVNATGDSLVLTGLESATNYYWQVQGICAPGDTGAISRPNMFQTDICPNATNLFLGDSTSFYGTSYAFPVNNFYQYSFSETIIDSAEFNGPFSIQAIALNYVGTSNPTKTAVDIYITKTDLTEFSGTIDVIDIDSTALKVYSGPMVCTPGWNLFGFDTTYYYDGTGNVAIIFVDLSGAYTGTGCTFSTVQCDEYKTFYNYADGYIPDPANLSSYGGYGYSPSSSRPDMKLISCEDLCTAPILSGAYATTYDSLTVSWNGSAASYEIAIKNVTDADYGMEIAVEGNSYSFGALEPVTGYMIRVRSICDTDLVSDWTEALFITDSLPCFNPSGMEVTNIAFASATLNWNAGGDENTWRLHVWNTILDTNIVVNAHPYTLTNLTPGVEYNAAVLSLCGDALNVESNEWSNTVTFTTNICDVVSGVNATVNGQNVQVSWTPGSNNTGAWEVLYGFDGFGQGDEIASLPVTTNSISINNLECYNTYDIYVRAKCEANVYSAWSTKVTVYVDCTGIHSADAEGNVSIYPNPASGATTISLAGMTGQVTLSIVDMNGKMVRSESMECDGTCVKTITVNDLAAGAYFVRVNSDNVTTVKKLIVK